MGVLTWPESEQLRQIQASGRKLSEQFSLPFSKRAWGGSAGNWAGTGVGSSIDFQDHRPYLPGDDPRYINWQAYARTGNYSMKLYREEVSPHTDLVLDCSGSMLFDDDKRTRSFQLLYFAFYSVLKSSSSLHCYFVRGDRCIQLNAEEIAAGDISCSGFDVARDGALLLNMVPFRKGSMRVLITDCLYPGLPDQNLSTLIASGGLGIVYSPCNQIEAEPAWNGNIEFADCESDRVQFQRINSSILEKYKKSYRKHFEMWTDSCKHHGIPFAQISSNGDLTEIFLKEALLIGAVEL